MVAEAVEHAAVNGAARPAGGVISAQPASSSAAQDASHRVAVRSELLAQLGHDLTVERDRAGPLGGGA